jgi:hypothetical protein
LAIVSSGRMSRPMAESCSISAREASRTAYELVERRLGDAGADGVGERMPWKPYSIATLRVRFTTPALAVAYGERHHLAERFDRGGVDDGAAAPQQRQDRRPAP